MILLVLISLLCCTQRSYGTTPVYERSSNYTPQIVNGEPTTIERHPGMARLYMSFFDGNVECDGTILSTIYVLSAAHCFDGDVFTVHIVIGVTHIDKHTPYYHGWYKSHPNFESGTDYDVAVVNSFVEFKFGPTVKPVTLASVNHLRTGINVTVVGWGNLKKGGRPSPDLRVVVLPVADFLSCKRNYDQIHLKISRLSFCAGFWKGGQGTCNGDSGGPAILNRVQVGIVSHSHKCAVVGYPATFTDIVPVREWIRQKTNV